MHPSALKSRLGAVCANIYDPDFKWSLNESNAALARKIIDYSTEEWESFSKKYNMFFNYETGEFYDIREMAHTIIQMEDSDDPEVRARAADFRKRIREIIESAES